MKLRGHVKIYRRGELFCVGYNLVTLAGENLNANFWNPGDATAKVDWCALGSGGAAASPSDTALVQELANSRSQSLTSDVVGSSISYTFDVTADAAWSVAEVGLFNAVSSGIMAARFTTQPFTMIASEVLRIGWTLDFTGD